ncbi:lipocalin family protein [Salinisphaera sp.]|uniref:lipocalin family protein n=1 Tax=Salinisphaera sp. TaxID=1914330 RepID=UPI000C3D9964|nr:lipocalin family protein [Salinisphaera sp.]MBS62086.1 lipocalin [Salinisphaera sp.]
MPYRIRAAWLIPLVAGSLLAGCVSIPKGTTAVEPFTLDRYLGRWYEIARLDHGFEEGLDCVTATYSAREDGGVRVVNRGVGLAEGKPDEAIGNAYFVDGEDRARLKVSFFGPFYAGYNVLALDDGYQTAIVGGPNRDYLWILARQPQLPASERDAWVSRAQAMGFDTAALVYPKQGEVCAPYRQS